EVYR
ncbi:hypothetical protein HKBW3S33_01033, partial [Candidatus Hakubella thermalkaliphila]